METPPPGTRQYIASRVMITETDNEETAIKVWTYSLFQKKRTFNSEFFCGPPGGGGPKTHLVDYRTPIYIINHVDFLPPSTRGATEKFGIKCAFLLE